MLFCVLLAALPTNDELAKMPEVAAVTVRGVQNPTHRIIHVSDWHYVSREEFALEGDSDDYGAFLDDVDAVQVEQMAFLKRIGVKKVFLEGLTKETHAKYVETVQKTKRRLQPIGNSPVDDLLAGFIREDMLSVGAAGRLLMDGQLDAVVPADDAAALRKANPIKDGKLVFDDVANEARENAIVKLLMQERDAVLVMGGGHDLSDNVPDGVQYVRVKLKRYATLSK